MQHSGCLNPGDRNDLRPPTGDLSPLKKTSVRQGRIKCDITSDRMKRKGLLSSVLIKIWNDFSVFFLLKVGGILFPQKPVFTTRTSKEESSLSIWHLKRKQKGKNKDHVTVVGIHLQQVFPRPPRGKPFPLCRNSLKWLFHSFNCRSAAHIISKVYL